MWDYHDPWNLVVIEYQLVRSYDELCMVTSQERHKYKEVLEVRFVHLIVGA